MIISDYFDSNPYAKQLVGSVRHPVESDPSLDEVVDSIRTTDRITRPLGHLCNVADKTSHKVSAVTGRLRQTGKKTSSTPPTSFVFTPTSTSTRSGGIDPP